MGRIKDNGKFTSKLTEIKNEPYISQIINFLHLMFTQATQERPFRICKWKRHRQMAEMLKRKIPSNFCKQILISLAFFIR